MNKLIQGNPWVWVVVLDPGGNEQFLGQHYKEEDVSFIPTFLEKEEALKCLDHLIRDKEKNMKYRLFSMRNWYMMQVNINLCFLF